MLHRFCHSISCPSRVSAPTPGGQGLQDGLRFGAAHGAGIRQELRNAQRHQLARQPRRRCVRVSAAVPWAALLSLKEWSAHGIFFKPGARCGRNTANFQEWFFLYTELDVDTGLILVNTTIFILAKHLVQALPAFESGPPWCTKHHHPRSVRAWPPGIG